MEQPGNNPGANIFLYHEGYPSTIFPPDTPKTNEIIFFLPVPFQAFFIFLIRIKAFPVQKEHSGASFFRLVLLIGDPSIFPIKPTEKFSL